MYAYYQQALSEMTDKIESDLKDINPNKNDNNHQTAVWDLYGWIEDWGDDFQKFRKSFWGKTRKQFRENLTPDNKRKLDKRIYDAWYKISQQAKKTFQDLLDRQDEMALMMVE